MAELEIHHEIEHADALGKKVGIIAAVLAVLLAIVTIVSHRAHTDAVLLKSEANDKWSYYQAKRIKFHSLELGEDLLNAMPEKNPEAAKMLARYTSEKKRYTKESAVAQDDARETLHTLKFSEKQILAGDGRWFSVRIMPYRTSDDRIDGVVITFADITAAKTLEAKLRAKQAGLEKQVADQSTQPGLGFARGRALTCG